MTGGAREIPVSGGFIALVDASDYERVSQKTWHANLRGSYVTVRHSWQDPRQRGKTLCIPLARFLLQPPPGFWVDHASGDTLDHRRCNLRLCTPQQNARNRGRAATSQAPYKCVSHGVRGRWRARIWLDGRNVNLGCFDTAKEAALAYDAAALIHFGEFARLNFPKAA